jgi:hypothetical protein
MSYGGYYQFSPFVEQNFGGKDGDDGNEKQRSKPSGT